MDPNDSSPPSSDGEDLFDPQLFQPDPETTDDQELGYEEAIRRILIAEQTRSSSLDLRGLSLQTLPAEIGRLGDFLTHLSLADNGLESNDLLAASLRPLSALSTLDLSDNNLESNAALADMLNPLVGLTQLALRDNLLETNAALADSLQSLCRLTSLNLQDNSLESRVELVRAFHSLNCLDTLFLRSNALESNASLSRGLRQLTSLNTLDLGNNALSSNEYLTDAIRPLKALRKLALHANRLESNIDLANAIRPLTALQVLLLHDNRLESNSSLADALGSLSLLRSLYLNNNVLCSNAALSRALCHLTALTSLNLRSNQLNCNAPFAIAIASLRTLNQLELGSNRLTSSPELANALQYLTSLKSLSLVHNELTSNHSLSAALCNLKQLTSLQLRFNKLEATASFSQALCSLTALKELTLNSNLLESNVFLRQGLSPLTQLKNLDLASNNIKSNSSLATAIGSLTALETLELGGNRSLGLPDEVVKSHDPARILRAISDIAAGETLAAPEFKVVILGEGRIGKTQLRRRLLHEQPVTNDVPTQSFEWVRMPGSIARDGCNEPGVVHLFDFGGQRALLSSHRFFLSHRRSIFVVCVSRTHTIRESRVAYWLQYVKSVRDQAIRRRVIQSVEQYSSGDSRGQPTFDELLRSEIASTPKIPVIVVVTNSRSINKHKLKLDELEVLCTHHGADLVTHYDSFDPPFPNDDGVDKVRRAIENAARSAALEYVWTEQYSSIGLARRQRIRQDMGFAQEGMVEAPEVRSMTLDMYLSECCDVTPETPAEHKDRLAAMDQLALLRDLGIVHWLGEREDLGHHAEHFRSRIFSPPWLRGPVYRVLWADDPSGEPLTLNRVEQLLRGSGSSALSEVDVCDALALMEACELLFEVQDANGVRRYLVPDRLPLGEISLILPDDSTWADGEHGYKLCLGFAPDSLMPRLVGKLSQRETCESLTRCSLIWSQRERSANAVRVRLCLDQHHAALRVGISSNDSSRRDRILSFIHNSVATVLGRHDLEMFQPCSARAIRINDTRQALTDQRSSLVAALIDPRYLSRPGANIGELELWFRACDLSKLAEIPWTTAVLMGLCRVVRGREEIDLSGGASTLVTRLQEWLREHGNSKRQLEHCPAWEPVILRTVDPKKKDALRKSFETARKHLGLSATPHEWLQGKDIGRPTVR